MLISVKAINEDGKIIFEEPLPVNERTEVIVIFLEEEKGEPQKEFEACYSR